MTIFILSDADDTKITGTFDISLILLESIGHAAARKMPKSEVLKLL